MNLQASLAHYNALKQRLLEAFPELAEDEQTLLDTLEGQADLQEALAEVICSALHDEELAAAMDSLVAKMKERKARFQARSEKKREIVAHVMESAGLKKIEAPVATISLRAVPPSVLISDENLLPDRFRKTKTVVTPDKIAIKEMLEAGKEVPGATLSNGGSTLSVRTK